MIYVNIIVDRDNLKDYYRNNGKMIKQIGIEARADIERLLGKGIS